jgi:hypothetical protein
VTPDAQRIGQEGGRDMRLRVYYGPWNNRICQVTYNLIKTYQNRLRGPEEEAIQPISLVCSIPDTKCFFLFSLSGPHITM